MIDLLCIAPHPDDAEIWCGGYLALASKQGYNVGVLDLSLGELSSRGDLKTRAAETKKASKILGLNYRANLRLKDGEICQSKKDIAAIVDKLRELKPKFLLLPYWEERHPDHLRASLGATEAVFFASLKKYPYSKKPPHSVTQVIYYIERVEAEPSFYVDITAVQRLKSDAISAYSSQVKASSRSPQTLLSDPLTASALEARDRVFGARIGVPFAEGFISRSAIALKDPIETLSYPERGAIQFFK